VTGLGADVAANAARAADARTGLLLDVSLPSRVDGAAALAAAAQGAGRAGGWVPETTADPFPAATAALLATSTLTVGTAVAVAFARSPFAVAQSAWELARFSGGRFVLGLGTQVKAHNERRFSVPWERPAARLRDYVLALRAIWAAFQGEAPLRHEGEFYRHTLLTPLFDPGPIEHPRIPVLLAAVNPAVAALGGEVADGIVGHPLTSGHYLSTVVLPALGRGLDRAGKDRAAVQVLNPVWVVSGTPAERDAAREKVRRQVGVYGSTRTYRAVFEAHGWGDLPDRLHALLAAGEPARLADLVTDEMVGTFAVDAPPAGLPAAIRARFAGLVDRTMLYEPVPPSLSAPGALGWS
jgi:probable F420-dependent oxidoreductase